MRLGAHADLPKVPSAAACRAHGARRLDRSLRRGGAAVDLSWNRPVNRYAPHFVGCGNHGGCRRRRRVARSQERATGTMSSLASASRRQA